MRMQTDKDCPPPTLDEMRGEWKGLIWTLAIVMVLLLVGGLWSVAQGAVTGQWRVQLIRGSTTVGQGVGDTEAAAWEDCESKIPKNATAPTVYACQTMRYYATVTPDPVCPPKPADEQRTQACPAPTVGSWVQDRVYTSAAFPTCWVLGEWTPPEPPVGMCAPPIVNSPPTITGSAPTTGTVGQLYTFTPTATDPDGDLLTFEIIARPPWSGWTFDAATGRMSGTPTTVRTHPGISITVNDGRGGVAELRLPTITISASAATPVNCVASAYGAWTGGAWSTCANGTQTRQETRTRTITTQPANGGTACPVLTETRTATQPCTTAPGGTALLSWTHDGVDGANVTGFRVVYGTSPAALAQTLQVNSETVRTANVAGLSAGTWYFAVKAFNASGESDLSNVVQKVIL